MPGSVGETALSLSARYVGALCTRLTADIALMRRSRLDNPGARRPIRRAGMRILRQRKPCEPDNDQPPGATSAHDQTGDSNRNFQDGESRGSGLWSVQGLAALSGPGERCTGRQQNGPEVVGATPPHGDPLRDSVSDARDRKQALGAPAVFNQNERTLAQLAGVKAVKGEVLAFACTMDEAHSAALTDLSRFAPDRNGTLGQAAAGAEGARKRLQDLHGQQFASQYLQSSVDSHEQALALLDTQRRAANKM